VNIRTLGVDLASADTTTAACIVDWERGGPRLSLLRARDVSDDAIVEFAREATVTGIDSPFGWPRPFTDAIAAYAAGAAWPRQKPEGLWFRLTDVRAQAIAGGRPPLSVSSDRIARPAERASRLPSLLGTRDGAARRDGADGVIEVYPAGALRCWGMATDGYKRPDGSAVRMKITDSIVEQVGLSLSATHRAALIATDHAIDPLVASLVARAFGLHRVVAPMADEQLLAVIEGWLYLPTGSLDDLR
jgi:predicted nuclease with RNAse H fold